MSSSASIAIMSPTTIMSAGVDGSVSGVLVPGILGNTVPGGTTGVSSVILMKAIAGASLDEGGAGGVAKVMLLNAAVPATAVSPAPCEAGFSLSTPAAAIFDKLMA